MPLPSSFWVDETVTAFVVRQGAAHPSLQIAPQVPASLYYALPHLVERLYGLSEIAYRIPSLLALCLALWLISRLAAKLIHPDAGWFAAFACLALRGFNYQASDARPYALGTCVLCAALWFLIRWMDQARWRDACLFAALAALVWRIHLIYWPLYGLFALYVLVRLVKKDTRVTWLRAVTVFGVVGLSLIPVLQQALFLNRQAAAHVVMPQPTLGELVHILKLGFVVGVWAAAAALSRWRHWPQLSHTFLWGPTTLLLGLWLWHPLSLFAFSYISGHSVFVPRYLCVALPGVGLAVTAAAALFLPAGFWRQTSAAFGLAVLLLLGQWNRIWPAHHNSDWRAAARTINQQSLGDDMPVLCPSPFIEAKSPVWRPDYPLPAFLYAHLTIYPVHGRVYPFPFENSPAAERFAGRLAIETLSNSTRFAIYGGDRNVEYWRNWFATRPEMTGWSSHRTGSFGDVEVVMFDRGGIPEEGL